LLVGKSFIRTKINAGAALNALFLFYCGSVESILFHCSNRTYVYAGTSMILRASFFNNIHHEVLLGDKRNFNLL
jgi:hypothetical protein